MWYAPTMEYHLAIQLIALTRYIKDKPWKNYAKSKKPDIEGMKLYDSPDERLRIVKSVETDEWLTGAEGGRKRGWIDGCRVFVWDDENILELDSGIQYCKCAQCYWIIHFKMVNWCYVYFTTI